MGYWLGIDMGTTFTAQEAGRRALTEVIPLGTRFTAELGRPVAIDADPQSRDRARHRPLRAPADTVGADASPAAPVPAAVGSTSAFLAGLVQTQALRA
jgi:hypothetical protein